MKVLASPLVPNSPLTPKSQSLTWPLRHSRMLEGLMSDEGVSHAIRPNPGKRKTRMLTSMDDFPAVQVSQTIQHAVSNLGEDLLARSATKFLDFLVDTIKTSTLAKLHGDGDSARGLVHEGTVVATDMIGRAVLVEIELANNLLFHVRVRVCSDDLQRTDMISRYPTTIVASSDPRVACLPSKRIRSCHP